MKLWLLTQKVNLGYDTYDSAVVAAETQKEAREMEIGSAGGYYGTWALPKDVSAEYLGEARDGHPGGIICASFNAG